MAELQKYYVDNDCYRTEPVALEWAQYEIYYRKDDVDAALAAKDAEIEELRAAAASEFERANKLQIEIERYKRAVEWCLENGAGGSTNDSDGAFAVRDCRDQLLCPPADIADIICPAAGEKAP